MCPWGESLSCSKDTGGLGSRLSEKFAAAGGPETVRLGLHLKLGLASPRDVQILRWPFTILAGSGPERESGCGGEGGI